MLKPADIFSRIAKTDVLILRFTNNDRFWEIPIDEYERVVLDAISKKIKKTIHRLYLTELVRYAAGDKAIKEDSLKELFKASKLDANHVTKDFGEVLAPFYAIRYIDKFMSNETTKLSKGIIKRNPGLRLGKKVDTICFPVSRNYPMFDFYIKNGYYFGFNVKAQGAIANTLKPTFVKERIENLPPNLKTEHDVELEIIEALATYSPYAGPVIALGKLINSDKTMFKNKSELRNIFRNVNFERDAMIIDSNRNADIDRMGLGAAYKIFMSDHILKDIKADALSSVEKEKYIQGELKYSAKNIVFGCGEFVSKLGYNFEPILRELFPDLHVVKVKLLSGIPSFELQSMVKFADIITKDMYHLRNKTSFNRVKDRLGIQL